MIELVSCYMCDAPMASKEHVPPRCFFPAEKDLPPGVSLRQNLITVPSCDAHNGAKSKDDLYLLYAVICSLPTNEVAKNHFAAAVMRRIQEKPALVNDLMKAATRVVAVDTQTGTAQATAAIDIDGARLDGALAHLARGLHLHHLGAKWTGPIMVHTEFLLGSIDPANARAINAPRELIVRQLDQAFVGEAFHGNNPDVFRYQVKAATIGIPTMMRLHFYGDVKVSLIFAGASPGHSAPDA